MFRQYNYLIVLVFTLSFFPGVTNALFSSELPRLHVNGKNLVTDTEDPVRLHGINVSDYSGFCYWTSPCIPNQSFWDVLSWWTTEEDYKIIKSMGFNAVRQSVTNAHFTEDGIARLAELMEWSWKNGLYFILIYEPPDIHQVPGYYSDATFWECILKEKRDSIPCLLIQKFTEQWQRLSDLGKQYPHVIYELMNEPQIPQAFIARVGSGEISYSGYEQTDDWFITLENELTEIYVDTIQSLTQLLQSNGDENILMIGGLNYSVSEYENFNFVAAVQEAIDYQNILYTFHYYMPDITFQACSWESEYCVEDYYPERRFTTTDPGWQTISFDFYGSDLYERSPWLRLTSYNQRGTYTIRSISITDSNNNRFLDESFHLSEKNLAAYDWVTGLKTTVPQAVPYPYCAGDCNMVLDNLNDPKKTWTTIYGGIFGSSIDSRVYIDESLTIVDSAKKTDSTGDFSNINFISYLPGGSCQWDQCSSSSLYFDPDIQYKLSIDITGELLHDNGMLLFDFYNKDTQQSVWKNGTKAIQNICHGNQTYANGILTPCKTTRLTSDASRVKAALSIMEELSQKYNVPFFMGEFGTSLGNSTLTEENIFEYLDIIIDNTQNFTGWAFHQYREATSNQGEDSRLISFQLYSGWDVKVADMNKTPGNLASQVGVSKYYYRPTMIHKLSKTLKLNQTANTARLVNLSTRADIHNSPNDAAAGFVLSGDGAQSVMLRGIAVEGSGINPALTLSKRNGTLWETIATNDEWEYDSNMSSVNALPSHLQLPDIYGNDAGMLRDLGGGVYTVQLDSYGNSGLGVVGIDAVNDSGPNLINISTRAYISGGENDAFAGFVIKGNGTLKVMLRGIAVDSGVNPHLELRKRNGSSWDYVESNDEWESQWNSTVVNTLPTHLQLPDEYDNDAGMLLDLPAGVYSLQLSSTGSPGSAVVGIDAVQY